MDGGGGSKGGGFPIWTRPSRNVLLCPFGLSGSPQRFASDSASQRPNRQEIPNLKAIFRAEKTMTATDVTGFDAIFSTGFFRYFLQILRGLSY